MVGLCIKYFHENYGGMLQALATTRVLEKYNLEYELIRYQKNDNLITKIKYLPRLLNTVLLNDKYEAFQKKIGQKRHPECVENEKVRSAAYARFRDDKFKALSPVYVGYEELSKGATRYEAVITGSDQLWSPAGLPTNYYNLMFAPDSVRKISYASSFGVSKIPWYQVKRTKQYLNRIQFISMRENRGAEIVKELTGRSVPTILDPVFMLNEREWELEIPCKSEINEPYIFSYILGKSPEHREAVKNIASRLGCKIVALVHINRYVPVEENFGDIVLYDVGPDRFLNLLRGADYVFTDSFHGTCFSIIHRKKFITFNRYDENSGISKNSRIDSLFENLGLQDRRYVGDNNLLSLLEQEIDYDSVFEKLGNLKLQTDEYLDTAFSGLARSCSDDQN